MLPTATRSAAENMAKEPEVEGLAPTGASPRKRQRTAIAPRAAPTIVEKEVRKHEFVREQPVSGEGVTQKKRRN